MKVAEAAAALSGTLVAGAASGGNQVRGGYASDLLSDVIANAREGDLWVTLQAHVNILAVAHLKELSGIVLVGGRQPEPGTVARADQENIPVVVSPLPAFEVVGILHAAGVRGRRQP